MTATEPDVRDLLQQIREAIHGDNGKVVESATESRQPWPLLEAARYLRVSVSTLKRAEKTGTLRMVRIGKRVFLTDEELRRVAREGMTTAAPVA